MDIYKDKILFDIKAKTHHSHPDTSREAAERAQPHVGAQAATVLRAVRLYGPCTAKTVDQRINQLAREVTTSVSLGNLAHRRMIDLADAKLVSRERNAGDRELTCTITKAGIAYLEGMK